MDLVKPDLAVLPPRSNLDLPRPGTLQKSPYPTVTVQLWKIIILELII